MRGPHEVVLCAPPQVGCCCSRAPAPGEAGLYLSCAMLSRRSMHVVLFRPAIQPGRLSPQGGGEQPHRAAARLCGQALVCGFAAVGCCPRCLQLCLELKTCKGAVLHAAHHQPPRQSDVPSCCAHAAPTPLRMLINRQGVRPHCRCHACILSDTRFLQPCSQHAGPCPSPRPWQVVEGGATMQPARVSRLKLQSQVVVMCNTTIFAAKQ